VRETAEETVARIRQQDPTLHSFISVIADPSLARAAALDAIPVDKRASYPLLPASAVAVKDNICTGGSDNDLRIPHAANVRAAVQRHGG